MTAANIHYELAERVQGLSHCGIGAMLLLARQTYDGDFYGNGIMTDPGQGTCS